MPLCTTSVIRLLRTRNTKFPFVLFYPYIFLLTTVIVSMSAFSNAFRIHHLKWKESAHAFQALIPPLTSSAHKGSLGRIGIIGGSKEYTGAPYYAAESSLKFGADLSYVLTAEQALIPIKCYSPELMVSSFYDSTIVDRHDDESLGRTSRSESVQQLTNILPRVHSLVVGPGLGRTPSVLSIVEEAITHAREVNKPLVIDADGLWLVTQNLSLILGYKNCILTPNAMEFKRLADAAVQLLRSLPAADEQEKEQQQQQQHSRVTEAEERQELIQQLSSPSTNEVAVQTRALARALSGVTIMRKGEQDVISTGEDVYIVHEPGTNRRCGGLGDILSGCTGVAFQWATGRSVDLPSFEMPPTVLACWLASVVARKASVLAFDKHRRSTTAPDVLKEIGVAFREVEDFLEKSSSEL